MRGLESTWTVPCDSRKLSNAAKLLVWNARPKTDAGVVAPDTIALVAEPIKVFPKVPSGSGLTGLLRAGSAVIVEPGSNAPSGPRAVNDDSAPSVRSVVPGCTKPPPKRLFGPVLNAPQLMPVANWSVKVTS